MRSDYDFHEEVSTALEAIGANKTPWFRGHAHGHHALLPSLLRQNNGRGIKYEPELYTEFVREAKDRTVNTRPFPTDDRPLGRPFIDVSFRDANPPLGLD